MTNESNFTYRGPTRDVGDLPCRIDGLDTFSIWTLTDEERQRIAAGANIRLGIHGMRPIPPVSLGVVETVGPYAPPTYETPPADDAHVAVGSQLFSDPEKRKEFVPRKFA